MGEISSIFDSYLPATLYWQGIIISRFCFLQCRSQDSGNDCLQEIFGSCSRKQLEHAWQKVYSVVSATLLGVRTRENDVEDEQVWQGCKILKFYFLSMDK